MTVQFILPEATSFPKERKLHDRLFLVLLYNLLCKTFKDHSSTFAASSRIRAHPSLARALLPDCECKGRAFLHSLQDFDEKKCEKISFAPILPLHSIAKSAVNPIFSPLPLPTFFAPKSPFFALFPVLDSISGTFSRARTRFLPCEAYFFLVFPHPDPNFWGFFEEYFAILPPPTAFSIHAPSPFTSLPHFLSLSSPLFYPPPHLTHDRAHPRAIRAYAYTRTHSHVRRFSFIAFTASPPLAIYCAPTRYG